MARRYTLDTKIGALNQLDQLDGDMLLVSEQLMIPIGTLRAWSRSEADLRRQYHDKHQRYVSRLKLDLQATLLQRGLDVLSRIDDEALDKAPLNQLASALGVLVNHALKLEEDIDEQEETERIIRVEYLYDGSVHETPPWARDRDAASGTVQDCGLREALGQNGIGQADVTEQRIHTGETWLVARADISDGESALAGAEDDGDIRYGYQD